VKKLVVIALLALVVFLGYHFVSDPQAFMRRLSMREQYGPDLRSIRDSVLSPLGRQASNPAAELHEMLRAVRSSSGQKPAQVERKRVVILLCDMLSAADDERERCEARLRDVRTKHYDGLAPGQSAKKRELYEADVIRKWDAYARRTRTRSEKLLTRLKAVE